MWNERAEISSELSLPAFLPFSLSLSNSHYLSLSCGVVSFLRFVREWYTRSRWTQMEWILEWEWVFIGNSKLDALIYEHDCMEETLAFSCFPTISPHVCPLYECVLLLFSSSIFHSVAVSIHNKLSVQNGHRTTF